MNKNVKEKQEACKALVSRGTKGEKEKIMKREVKKAIVVIKNNAYERLY